MGEVFIEGTVKTPEIKLNATTGAIEIKGRSIPENTTEFYWPMNRWLSEYSTNPAKKTSVNIALTYMNSSSSVILTRMMQLLDNLIGLKSKVSVNWYCEKDDMDMLEMGKDYQKIMRCEVVIHEVDKLL